MTAKSKIILEEPQSLIGLKAENIKTSFDIIIKTLLIRPLYIQEMKEISLFLNIMSEKEMNKTFNMSNRMLEHLFHAMHQNQAKDGYYISSYLEKLYKNFTNLEIFHYTKKFVHSKSLGFNLPFNIGKYIDYYIQKFKNPEYPTKDIINSLLHIKDELLANNTHIDIEIEQIHKIMQHLEQYSYVMKKLDERIESQLTTIAAKDKLKASNIRQEILFPLRQRRLTYLQNINYTNIVISYLFFLKKNS